MADGVAERLAPTRRTDRGVHLGGIKPAVPCAVGTERFEAFARDYSASTTS
jgi:hypothetical protein